MCILQSFLLQSERKIEGYGNLLKIKFVLTEHAELSNCWTIERSGLAFGFSVYQFEIRI